MDKKELYTLLSVREKQFDKAREKRLMKTVLSFTIVFFLLLCCLDKPIGLEYIFAAVVAFVMAVIHVLINGAIFGYLSMQSELERKILEDIRKQLSE
jgi:uncharacterized membrane protein